MKKDQKLPNKKTFIVTIALENHYQTAQILYKINHIRILTTEVDHRIKEIHEIPHKIDISEHTVQIIIIEKSIHDQTQTDRTTRLILFKW